MTTIITAADAADFLALIPRLAGFHPSHSVVLVPFDGSRTLGALRVDLPDDAMEVDRVAATLTGMVCRVGDADGVAIVVYTDHPLVASDGAMAYAGFVDALKGRADACGLRVVDALCVAGDAWGSYLRADAAAHPRPLADLREAHALDAVPADLPSPTGDQSAGAELPTKDLAQRETAARALRALGDAVDAVCTATGTEEAARSDLAALDPQALAAACALDDVPALFEDALEWDAGELRPFDAAAMIWCLSRPALRDIALVQWCGDIGVGDDALRAQLRWERGDDFPEHLAAYLWGDADRPDARRLRAALDLVRHCAALTPRASRPGPLAAAGWLSWALGRSTHAHRYAAEALAIDPEHGLGGIVSSMVAAAHLPEWAFDTDPGSPAQTRPGPARASEAS